MKNFLCHIRNERKELPVLEKKFLRIFFICSFTLMLLAIGIVVLFDPFYQYHKPLPGCKAVLSEKEYQCIGTLRHFDYDAVLVGSSVCENYSNNWFDDAYQCKTIKAIRSYGATADLCYLLDIANENQNLKYVFYNIDPTSLSAEPTLTFESAGCPMYLYDKNPFNDYPYWFNKDVIFKRIPYMLAYSFIGNYNEGDSYNWAQWKTFSKDSTLMFYNRPEEIQPMLAEDGKAEEYNANIALLVKQVEEHPDTEFHFFFPPYSILWWDYAYRNGELDYTLYNEKQAIATLLSYPNVKMYYFQDEEEIISNLDLYMDYIHFSKDINYYMFDQMAKDENRITLDNYEDKIEGMRSLSYKILEEYMPLYY